MFPNGPWSSPVFQNKLYAEHRMLCHKHFKVSSFIDYSQRKLHRHAAPVNDEHNEVADVADFTTNFCAVPGPSQQPLMEINKRRDESDVDVTPGQSTPLGNIHVKASTADKWSPKPSCSHSEGHEITGRKKVADVADVTTNFCAVPGPSQQPLMEINKRRDESDVDVTPGQSTPLGNIHVKASTADKWSPKPSCSHSEAHKKTERKKPCEQLLSGKDRYYYQKSRKYLRTICQLRNTIKKYKTKYTLSVVSENNAVRSLQKKISPTFALLLQSQIKNFTRKPKGRRWSDEDKIIALRLYKRSPTCYRLLRRLFCLPTPSFLKKLLAEFHMPPGINEKVLRTLRNFSKSQTPSENQYIVMFDEMSIKKHLHYNKKFDNIEGFQDHGDHGRTSQEAVKALVFMVAGIRKPVKQPLSYYMSGANVTADRLMVLIKENLRKCFDAGLNISATVCDMGGTNRRALALLGATAEHPILKINNREVVALFDAPHLLKCFRNMFMKYDIKCKTDIIISTSGASGEGIAKWSDIKNFYEIDSLNPNFVFAPSLRKEHLEPNTKQKMKINLAAQVLSHTVACGMFSKVADGTLPARAVVTATVISKIDKLFDLVNSDTPDRRRGKPYATNMSNNSPHKIFFLEMKTFFNELTLLLGAQDRLHL